MTSRNARLLASFFCFLTAFAAQAAVSGKVLNQTTGQAQPGAVVTLYSLGQNGMQPVKTMKSSESGAFDVDYTLDGPHLLQTIHAGVVYTKMIPPGAPSTGLELEVYDSTSDPDAAAIIQHMVLIEPLGGILHINESIVASNSGDRTYNDPGKGAVRIFLPESAQGEPRLMATAPQGMPVQRDVVETGDPGVYLIDFPVKPGETRFDLTYVLPQADPLVFTGKVLHGGGPVRLVAPQGVTLSGEAITQIGEEPQTHAKVYDLSAAEYAVTVEGAGSLSVPAGAAPDGSAPPGGASIQQINARIYDRVYLITGLALLILAAGFLLLYRRPGLTAKTVSSPPPGDGPKGEGKGG